MILLLKTFNRLFLVAALLVLSLRPSAVNCPGPALVHAGMQVAAGASVSDDASSEPVLRRCSFMRMETHHDLKLTAQVALAGFQNWSSVFVGGVKPSSVVCFAVPSSSTPLRI